MVRFIASTQTIDRYQTRLVGWDLTHFKKNPVIPFGHDYSGLPIGRAVAIEEIGGDLLVDIEFAPRETYQFADDVYRMVRDGYLNATSVGFIPGTVIYMEDEEILEMRNNQLLEVSVVTVPANPEALKLSMVRGIFSEASVRQVCEDGLGEIEDLPQLRAQLEEWLQSEFPEYETKDLEQDGPSIGYKSFPESTEDDLWDASAQVRNSTTDDLLAISCWCEVEERANPSAFSLIHHYASDYTLSRAGVIESMATLLTGEHGIATRDGVIAAYEHLLCHLSDLDLPTPKFNDWAEGEEVDVVRFLDSDQGEISIDWEVGSDAEERQAEIDGPDGDEEAVVETDTADELLEVRVHLDSAEETIRLIVAKLGIEIEDEADHGDILEKIPSLEDLRDLVERAKISDSVARAVDSVESKLDKLIELMSLAPIATASPEKKSARAELAGKIRSTAGVDRVLSAMLEKATKLASS